MWFRLLKQLADDLRNRVAFVWITAELAGESKGTASSGEARTRFLAAYPDTDTAKQQAALDEADKYLSDRSRLAAVDAVRRFRTIHLK